MARVGLVHGLGGTGATMRPLAAALEALGHECLVPTLPGHGTRVDDLRGRSWSEWLAAVPDADILVGQSMGAALCLAAAALRPDSVRAVVAINCPTPDADAVEGLEWRVSRGHDLIDGPPLAEGESGYGQLPLTALLEMTRGILDIDFGAVRARVTLVTSALDDVVDPSSVDVLGAALPTSPRRVTLPRSGHVATLGPDLAMIVAVVD